MLEQNLKMREKTIALLRNKMKLFSKKNIFQIKMDLVGLTALRLKGSLNRFPTKVKDSLNQYSIKIHSKMTISTRISRKVTTQVVKSFSRWNIGFPPLMTFCRNFIPILYYQLWLKTIKSRHWISNLLIPKTISNFRWSLGKAPILKWKTLNSAKESRKCQSLTRLLTASLPITGLKPAIIPSLHRKCIKANNLTSRSKCNRWILVCQTTLMLCILK